MTIPALSADDAARQANSLLYLNSFRKTCGVTGGTLLAVVWLRPANNKTS
jgi:hypothetical protein